MMSTTSYHEYMSLQKKVLLFIAVINITIIAAMYLVANGVLRNNFNSLEVKTVERNVIRAGNALNSVVTQISILCADYAGWDDTYNYIESKDQQYIDANFVDETFASTQLNYILIVDTKGELIYSKGYDYHKKEKLDLPSDISQLTSLNAIIQANQELQEGVTGIVNLASGSQLVAAYPIVTSEKQGPIRGTLIMVRTLDQVLIDELRKTSNLNVNYTTSETQTSLKSDKSVVSVIDQNKIQGVETINDVRGNPAIEVKVIMDREITAQLNNAIVYLVGGLGVLGLLSLIIGLAFIHFTVISPIKQLVSDVNRITKTGKFSFRVRVTGKDEIAQLAQNVNNMIESLEQSTKTVLEVNKELKKQRTTIEEQVDTRTHELKEEEARFIASINSFPDAYIITDTSGNILLTNNMLSTTLDVKRETWTLQNLKETFSTHFDIERNMQLSLLEKKALLMSGISYKKKFLKVYIAPVILSGKNEVIGTVILISDITEDVLSERSKDEFLSIASHELRTPLSAIKGNSELLKSYFADKIDSDDFKEMIEDIYRASTSLIELVNSFLTTSRLEQDRLQFNNESFALDVLAESVVQKYQVIANQKEIKISVSNQSHNEIMVSADKQRVEEVLTNLIGNAIKYTDKGTIKVIISKQSDFVKVSVADTGRGIPMKQQALLFKKFQQASKDLFTRDIAHGAGLGLYISKLMIELMGGEIYLEQSTENKGSIFTFTIPLAK